MKTTVVIPNYNGNIFCRTVWTACFRAVEFAVIVVDNGSTDGSVSWIQEHFPQVKLICFSENKGFCTAVNTGIEAAATPYVFLLNNDTKTDRFCLERLERAMEADEKIFSVGAKMLSMKRTGACRYGGGSVLGIWLGVCDWQRKAFFQYTAPKRVFPIAQGRRSTARHIWSRSEGSTSFILHTWKMWDIGYRAQIFGLKNVTEPAAVVYHAGSGSTGSRYNAFKVTHSSRNNIYLIYKNMPLLQLILNLPFCWRDF